MNMKISYTAPKKYLKFLITKQSMYVQKQSKFIDKLLVREKELISPKHKHKHDTQRVIFILRKLI